MTRGRPAGYSSSEDEGAVEEGEITATPSEQRESLVTKRASRRVREASRRYSNVSDPKERSPNGQYTGRPFPLSNIKFWYHFHWPQGLCESCGMLGHGSDTCKRKSEEPCHYCERTEPPHLVSRCRRLWRVCNKNCGLRGHKSSTCQTQTEKDRKKYLEQFEYHAQKHCILKYRRGDPRFGAFLFPKASKDATSLLSYDDLLKMSKVELEHYLASFK